MEQSQQTQTVNPWLISYISQNQHKQSRYEIDKYLIEAGCPPSEIEFVWQNLSYLENRQRLERERYNRLRKDENKQQLASIIGMVSGGIGIAAGGLVVLMSVIEHSYYNDAGELVPAPNSTMALLLIGLSVIGFIGAWQSTEYPERGGSLQLVAACTSCSFITSFGFGSYYAWSVVLAISFSVAGSLALSTSPEVPRWMQKTWRLMGISLITLIGIPVGLAALIHIFI